MVFNRGRLMFGVKTHPQPRASLLSWLCKLCCAAAWNISCWWRCVRSRGVLKHPVIIKIHFYFGLCLKARRVYLYSAWPATTQPATSNTIKVYYTKKRQILKQEIKLVLTASRWANEKNVESESTSKRSCVLLGCCASSRFSGDVSRVCQIYFTPDCSGSKGLYEYKEESISPIILFFLKRDPTIPNKSMAWGLSVWSLHVSHVSVWLCARAQSKFIHVWLTGDFKLAVGVKACACVWSMNM